MKGLVLSGGGRKGAFQTGVISELASRPDFTGWNYVAGTSVGALNTSVLAQHPACHQRAGAAELLRTWEEMSGDRDVWKHWLPFGPIEGLWKESFYNSSPLAKMVQRWVNPAELRASGVESRYGVVAYGNGEYREVTQDAADIHKWILASSAFPGFLIPQWIDGELWIDGGARRITPLAGAIDAGCTEIDVVVCSPLSTSSKPPVDNWWGTKLSALTVLARTIELMTDEIILRDIKTCQKINELMQECGSIGSLATRYRYIDLRVWAPVRPLVDGALSSLNFDPVVTKRLVSIGQDLVRRSSV